MSEPLQSPQAQNAPPIAPLDIIPPDILELLGPPPLLPHEDVKVYFATLAFFARSIRPGEDLIAWMLIKDLADHRTEIARYRRFKAALAVAAYRRSEKARWRELHARRITALKLIAERDIFLAERSGKHPEEIAKVTEEIETKLKIDLKEEREDHFMEIGFLCRDAPTETHVVEGFGSWIEDVERIDILLQAAERRFRATLEEIDRHLRGLGRFLREELDQIIEGSLVNPEPADAQSSETPLAPTSISGEPPAHPLPATTFARRAVNPGGSGPPRSATRKRIFKGRRSQASR
jgi:hypothetical protein